jgi:hypothetical protein
VVGRGVETVVITALPGEKTSSVRAVDRMAKAQRKLSLNAVVLPMFHMKSGRVLWNTRFLSTVNHLLTSAGENKISGKSFRAGFPPDLGRLSKAGEQLVKALGRWAGDSSFKRYFRTGLEM